MEMSYAIAQGNLVVGGLGVKVQMVQVQSKEHQQLEEFQMVLLEKSVKSSFLENDNIVLNLHQADFSQLIKLPIQLTIHLVLR